MTNQEFKEEVLSLLPDATVTNFTAIADRGGAVLKISYKHNEYSVASTIGAKGTGATLEEALKETLNNITGMQNIASKHVEMLESAISKAASTFSEFQEQVTAYFPNAIFPSYDRGPSYYQASVENKGIFFYIRYFPRLKEWEIKLSSYFTLSKTGKSLEDAFMIFCSTFNELLSEYSQLNKDLIKILSNEPLTGDLNDT